MQISTTLIRKVQVSLTLGVVALLAACTQVSVPSGNVSTTVPVSQAPASPTDLTLEVNPYAIEESFSTRELQDEINAIQRQRDADRLSNYLDRIQNAPPTRLP